MQEIDSLINRCLLLDPNQRPTTEEIFHVIDGNQSSGLAMRSSSTFASIPSGPATPDQEFSDSGSGPGILASSADNHASGQLSSGVPVSAEEAEKVVVYSIVPLPPALEGGQGPAGQGAGNAPAAQGRPARPPWGSNPFEKYQALGFRP